MSCNGCRVLRKGCNDNCILRQSLQCIDSHQAQANATVFVAKFFGRAGLMSFLSSVHESQRPALFQSLLFEACGRTVNPVNGAVGLLWTGNWHLCQAAMETVLRGGALRPIQEFPGQVPALEFDDGETGSRTTNKIEFFRSHDLNFSRKIINNSKELTTARQEPPADLNLRLTQGISAKMNAGGTSNRCPDKRREETPSEESAITTLASESSAHHQKTLQGKTDTTVLRLFF